jgi:hypothetical protein
VAEERGVILGDEVGYAIRFDDCWDEQTTKIKVSGKFNTLYCFTGLVAVQGPVVQDKSLTCKLS